MTSLEDRGGVILAGGRSERFGRTDKAVAPLNSKPLIEHVLERLNPVVSEVVINCRAEQQPHIQDAIAESGIAVTYAIDPTPDRGPLAGIATGLSAIQNAEAAFITACDMPLIEPALIETLFETLNDADAIVPRLDNQWLQTTHAVYRCQPMLAACEAALTAGDGRIVSAIDRLSVKIIDGETVQNYGTLDSFRNINTQAELEALEQERNTAT